MVIETEISPYQALIQRLNDKTEKLSFSSFNKFCESPRHFMAYKLEKKEPTAAMAFGTLVHCAVLEPDEIENRYIIEDLKLPSTQEAINFCNDVINEETVTDAFIKSGWALPKDPAGLPEAAAKKRSFYSAYIDAQLDAASQNKIICTQEDYNHALRLKDELYRNNASRWILDEFTETEKGITWEFGGFKWRGFIDGLGKPVIGDLKVLADANPYKVKRKILHDMHYDRQAAMYKIGGGYPNKDYYVIAVDKGGNSCVIHIDDHAINKAWAEINWYMERFRDCIMFDAWNESYNFFGPDRGIYNLSDI